MSPVKLLGVITWHERESYCYGFSLYHCKLNNNSDFKNKALCLLEEKMSKKHRIIYLINEKLHPTYLSWSEKRMTNTDIEYILKSEYDKRDKELLELIGILIDNGRSIRDVLPINEVAKRQEMYLKIGKLTIKRLEEILQKSLKKDIKYFIKSIYNKRKKRFNYRFWM